jgi:hypothetical protein
METSTPFSINGLEAEILTDIDAGFVNYVHDFYGRDEVYGEEFFPPHGVTIAEIMLATKIRKLMNIDLPFGGDSIDREIVRDIMLEARKSYSAQGEYKKPTV